MNTKPHYYWPGYKPWPFDIGEESDIKYMGTAQSDFQSDPFPDDDRQPTSDWEYAFKQDEGSEDNIIAPKFHSCMGAYFDRSLELGENMYRISFDIARLCPSIDQYNREIMKKYLRMLIRLRLRGLEPMLTLYHWPLPLELCEIQNNKFLSGGWEHQEVVEHFNYYSQTVRHLIENKDYRRKVLEELDLKPEEKDSIMDRSLVKYFITINEPSTLWINSYLAGIFPPYKKYKLFHLNKILDKVAQVHENMSEHFWKHGKIGVAHNWTYFDGWLGNYLQKQINERITHKFEQQEKYSDFIALQYYSRATIPSVYTSPVPLSLQRRPSTRDYCDHPGFGDIFPEGIYHLLKRMHQLYPSKPLWVTEFGFADNSDLRRPHWLAETVRWILQAKKEGIPVHGILHWSLVQNYEWDQGMKVSFGLFEERELWENLVPDETSFHGKTRVRSWEIWKALLAFNYCPGEDYYENLKRLRYEAYIQYENYKKNAKG